VFGGVEGDPISKFVGEGESVRVLSDRMQDAWIAFAHGSAPDEWPAYDSVDRHTWVCGEEFHVRSAPFEDERRAWEGVGDA
jgi:carboxylesterase type B